MKIQDISKAHLTAFTNLEDVKYISGIKLHNKYMSNEDMTNGNFY